MHSSNHHDSPNATVPSFSKREKKTKITIGRSGVFYNLTCAELNNAIVRKRQSFAPPSKKPDLLAEDIFVCCVVIVVEITRIGDSGGLAYWRERKEQKVKDERLMLRWWCLYARQPRGARNGWLVQKQKAPLAGCRMQEDASYVSLVGAKRNGGRGRGRR